MRRMRCSSSLREFPIGHGKDVMSCGTFWCGFDIPRACRALATTPFARTTPPPFNVGTRDDAAHQEALLDADVLPQHRATVQLAFW
jgi:hypothetical protein